MPTKVTLQPAIMSQQSVTHSQCRLLVTFVLQRLSQLATSVASQLLMMLAVNEQCIETSVAVCSLPKLLSSHNKD